MKPALPGHVDAVRLQHLPVRGRSSSGSCSAISLSRSVGIFVHNASLLKKVNLPKLAFPIVVALSGLSNFVVIFVLFLGFLAVIGRFPGRRVSWRWFPSCCSSSRSAIGLGVLLGTINVFYRDVEQSTSMLLQFWFWLTPIVYPGRALPGLAADLLAWNPMWPIVNFAQAIFLDRPRARLVDARVSGGRGGSVSARSGSWRFGAER